MKRKIIELMQDVKGVLHYHQSSGISNYPIKDDFAWMVRNQVVFKPVDGPETQVDTGQSQSSAPVADVKPSSLELNKSKEHKQQLAEHDSTTIEDIVAEVNDCKACQLISERIMPVAGVGKNDAKLLIVGDWLTLEQQAQPERGLVFGVEQDAMVKRMVEAIELAVGNVFITNTIKCGIPETCQPKAEHVKACCSYLLRQINLIRPKVILSMGNIATRTLLNSSEPLSRLRGKLHTCNAVPERSLPLIATYHPSYLLQNPEMKKATWADLQLLARFLATA